MGRMRLLAIAIVASMLASSMTSVALATDDGGSTTGTVACSLQVAATGGVSMSGTSVVPFEEFTLSASGYTPNGDGELLVIGVERPGDEVFPVEFTDDGSLSAPFFFARDGHGDWLLTLRQEDPDCSDQVEIRVLPLDDVIGNKFLTHIKWLFLEGITSGCTSTTFCPNGIVTRGQLATFLTRALSLPATSTDYFTDDETNKHEANINRLREAGITFGCTATTFCPDGLVTRGQMASFLMRAFDRPPTSTDYFTDDEGNKHEANINRLRAAGITFGCGGTNFCPNGLVTRGQMAAFLHRVFED